MIHKLLGLHIGLPARDHTEKHRVATTLELLYDLVMVIAIASAATALHHSIVDNHIWKGLISFVLVFWAIWWAWMNFTWFASSYDTDDVYYRIAVFIQLLGSLIMASAVKEAFENWDFTVVTVGYVIMRIALVGLWIRVIKSNPQDRVGAIRRTVSIMLCQIGWIFLNLFLPKSMLLGGFVFLAVCEHLGPFFANLKVKTKWHRHHIIERYGLLTIIVLGESILSLVFGMQKLTTQYDHLLANVLAGGFLILLMMWWLYFAEKDHPALTYTKRGFIWGYGHYFIFAPATATGAGLAVAIDHFTGHSHISTAVANASVAIPVGIYLVALWVVHDLVLSARYWVVKLLLPCAALVILALSFWDYGILAMGAVMIATLVLRLRIKHAEIKSS